MNQSLSSVFVILCPPAPWIKERGNPQSPKVNVNRKHPQVTKTRKKVSRNLEGYWKFASLWGSVSGHWPNFTHSNLATGNIPCIVIHFSPKPLSQPPMAFSSFLALAGQTIANCKIAHFWWRYPLRPGEGLRPDEGAVAFYQGCVLFPVLGPRSLTGCCLGCVCVEGGKCTPTCLWPSYNCCPDEIQN